MRRFPIHSSILILMGCFVGTSLLSSFLAESPIDPKLTFSPAADQSFTETINLDWTRKQEDSKRSRQMGATLRAVPLDRSAPPGRRWYTFSCTRLWYRQVGGEKRPWKDYDSAKDNASPPVHLPWEATTYAALLNHPIQVQFDDIGRAITVEGWEDAFAGMIESFRTMESVSKSQELELRDQFPEAVLSKVLRPTRVPISAPDSQNVFRTSRASEFGMIHSAYRVLRTQSDFTELEVNGSIGERAESSSVVQGSATLFSESGWLQRLNVVYRPNSSGNFTHTIRVSVESP